MQYKYYKIPHEWAVKLGMEESAPQHPDGMHLITPGPANVICQMIQQTEGLNLLPEEAYAHMGAIGLSAAEANASAKGELRHDAPETSEADEDRPTTEDPQPITED